ncbi:hypothetical protein M8J76_010817 [Diaphorina citri]|nr:hypothetical protein M8J76_010817 [Diaphorina citri]
MLEKMSNGYNGNSDALEPSDLSKIDNPPDSPFDLFKEWFEGAKSSNLVLPHALILSTATSDGKVSSRTLLLRRLEEDGFSENKHAALVFLWCYRTGNGDQAINRQVRVEGELEILTRDRFEDLYNREPLYCKIRAHLCHQDQATDWDEAKATHDAIYDKCKRGVDLPMPGHFIAYKLHPRTLEFYHAYSNEIADRILYSKASSSTQQFSVVSEHLLNSMQILSGPCREPIFRVKISQTFQF